MSYRGLGQWAELISTVINAGAGAYAKDVSKDIAASQLELAKINAGTEIQRLQAAALQRQVLSAPAGGFGLGAGLTVGTLALLAGGGLLAYMLLRRGRR